MLAEVEVQREVLQWTTNTDNSTLRTDTDIPVPTPYDPNPDRSFFTAPSPSMQSISNIPIEAPFPISQSIVYAYKSTSSICISSTQKLLALRLSVKITVKFIDDGKGIRLCGITDTAELLSPNSCSITRCRMIKFPLPRTYRSSLHDRQHCNYCGISR